RRPSLRTQPFRGLTRRGFSITELAVVTGLILAIAAIPIPIYVNSRNEPFDTKSREHIEPVGNQAASRLIRDRAYTYADYVTPDVLAETILSGDAAYTLVPLSDGDGDHRYITSYLEETGDTAAVGDGINDEGALVLVSTSGS